MRVGLLGGSFDPPHAGHLAFAEAALEALELDEVVFLPTNRNPLKKEAGATPAQRMEMLRILVGDRPKMAISDVEITRGGPSYTVDTLSEFHFASPAEYWFLIGADAIRSLHQWKQPQRLMRLCRFGVALRPPMTETDLMSRLTPDVKERVDLVRMPLVDISSTELRDRVARGRPLKPWAPPALISYINEKKLYRG